MAEKKTNSLVNMLMMGKTEKVPVVGMGVTMLMWTDRHAGTITRVSPSGKTFWFKEDIATRTDGLGMTDCQSYSYAPNPAAEERICRRTPKGKWTSKGTPVALDIRDEHYDFSF